MANKKTVRSQSNVPFSWEEKPGISKFSNNTGQNAIIRPLQYEKSPSSFTNIISSGTDTYSMKISPPPCGGGGQPPNRSNSSTRSLWWRQDDPFIAAMKQCTKNIKQHYGLPSEGKLYIGSHGRNKKIIFSCKKSSSCDVREDNLVRLPSNKFPPLPRERKKK